VAEARAEAIFLHRKKGNQATNSRETSGSTQTIPKPKNVCGVRLAAISLFFLLSCAMTLYPASQLVYVQNEKRLQISSKPADKQKWMYQSDLNYYIYLAKKDGKQEFEIEELTTKVL